MFYNQLVNYTKIEIGEAKTESIMRDYYQPLNFELLQSFQK